VNRWLEFLPHQIPFRAASSSTKTSDSSVEGCFISSPDDALYTGGSIPEILVVEAMAQIAGSLVFGPSAAPGFLSAIDEARFEGPLVLGERLELRVTLDAQFGRIHRFRGIALRGGLQFATAKFYLAGAEETAATDAQI